MSGHARALFTPVRAAAVAGWLVCTLLASHPSLAQAPRPAASTPGAYDLKAAFLFQFPHFVEWPATVFADRRTFDICVVRPNPFGTALQTLTDGELLNGRPFAVREIAADAPLNTCHMLFVPAAVPNPGRIVERAAALPVLTVGESERFLDEGGIIRLYVLDRRGRFDINAAAADRVMLRLRAQLLQLAVVVRGRSA